MISWIIIIILTIIVINFIFRGKNFSKKRGRCENCNKIDYLENLIPDPYYTYLSVPGTNTPAGVSYYCPTCFKIKL